MALLRMSWTLEQLKQTKVGQLPSNQRLVEVKPGLYRGAPAVDHPMHLQPQQIGNEDGLNKTERRYLAWVRTLGDVRIWVQAIGLRLGKKAFYYPDVAALDKNGFRFIDIKALYSGQTQPHVEDDALVKLKWASQLYAPCVFLIAWEDPETKNWKHRQIVS